MNVAFIVIENLESTKISTLSSTTGSWMKCWEKICQLKYTYTTRMKAEEVGESFYIFLPPYGGNYLINKLFQKKVIFFFVIALNFLHKEKLPWYT